MKFRYISAALLCVLLLFSCSSVSERNVAEAVSVPSEKNTGNSVQNTEPLFQSSLTLLFGGDIMAHRVNFSMKDYYAIWKEVKPLVRTADFSFANIESPVDDDLTVSGGSKTIHYMISSQYMDQDRIMKNTAKRRFNFRSNVDSEVGIVKVG